MKEYISFYRRQRFGKVNVMKVHGYDTKKELAKDMKSIGLKVVSILSTDELEFIDEDDRITIEAKPWDGIPQEYYERIAVATELEDEWLYIEQHEHYAEAEVTLKTFTGMVIGKYFAETFDGMKWQLTTHKGVTLYFGEDFKEIGAKNPKFANRIEF
jgi:hypothetical protein